MISSGRYGDLYRGPGDQVSYLGDSWIIRESWHKCTPIPVPLTKQDIIKSVYKFWSWLLRRWEVQKWDLTFIQSFLGDSVEDKIKVPFKWGCTSNGQGASRMGPEGVCPKVDPLDNNNSWF